jgi:hypothetical protein
MMTAENVAIVTINAEADGPWSVMRDCSIALGLMLAMEGANVLDEGQRHMVVGAMARLDQVTSEMDVERSGE